MTPKIFAGSANVPLADAVDAEIEQRHGDDPAFRQAQEQSGRVGRLLADGALRPWLGIAVAR